MFTTLVEIKTELYTNGPLMVDMWLYEDFMSYSEQHGVYKHNRGPPIGAHTLTLLGWGVDDQSA